ncbi:replication initiator [Streptomyces sp. NPDC020096]
MVYPATPDARRSALAYAERLRALSETERDLIRLVNQPDFPRWLEQIHATGGCAHPIYLSGRTTVRDARSEEVIRHYDTAQEPGGRLAVRCRNRRDTRCPPCARLHAGDTYQLVRSGLVGGKKVPSTVAGHPRLFVTLTAPSFGAVHGATGRRCHPRRQGGQCPHGRPVDCGLLHADSDPLVGQPLCRSCYDYAGHVLWHAMAGRLWNRTCTATRRHLASSAGIAQTRLRDHLVVSFTKVAEYQRRGAVHFHAVVRLDGPDGPGSPPPPWATIDLLEEAIRQAATATHVRTPYSPATGELVMRWGAQVDAHEIRGALGTGATVTDDAVAAYVAKYVGKSVGDAGGVDQRVRSAEEIRLLPVNAHLRALMVTCWRLGGLADLEELRLRAWAHTLGYRGHVLTKSRAFSTTYKALRAARADYQSGATEEQLDGLEDETETTSAWRYVGSGHTPAEAEIARGIAEDLAQSREIARVEGTSGSGVSAHV